jgi:hypothetical protein
MAAEEVSLPSGILGSYRLPFGNSGFLVVWFRTAPIRKPIKTCEMPNISAIPCLGFARGVFRLLLRKHALFRDAHRRGQLYNVIARLLSH